MRDRTTKWRTGVDNMAARVMQSLTLLVICQITKQDTLYTLSLKAKQS